MCGEGRAHEVITKNCLAAVGAETHAVEGGVVGRVAAVVHAVGLGVRHVLKKVHVGAGHNPGVACIVKYTNSHESGKC